MCGEKLKPLSFKPDQPGQAHLLIGYGRYYNLAGKTLSNESTLQYTTTIDIILKKDEKTTIVFMV